MELENISVGKLIITFILIAVGIGLLNAVADNIFLTSDLNAVINETVDISAARLPGGGFDESVKFSLANDNIRVINQVRQEDTGTVLNGQVNK